MLYISIRILNKTFEKLREYLFLVQRSFSVVVERGGGGLFPFSKILIISHLVHFV